MMMSAALSPKLVRRRGSTRRRAASHPPHTSQAAHDSALTAIRSFLKGHTVYDAFPVSFRLIVLDTKLTVKKALHCLLINGHRHPHLLIRPSNVFLFQASYQHPYGTAKSRNSPGCSPYWTSYTSSSTTITLPPTTMRRRMSKPSGSSH